MTTNDALTTKNVPAITIVDAPKVSLSEKEEAGELLLHFYRALGWNDKDNLDPCKIQTTQEVYDGLCKQMYGRCSDAVAVGMFMVNKGPSTDNSIPANKVYLYEGWVTPSSSKGGDVNAA
jgi:hypothetical protein